MAKTNTINNSQWKDSGGKLIFENATLCSQFLREYTGIEELKDVRPEDIEDMTERFIPMFTEERESDVVKKVHLPGERELFMVTLIEHKSSVDYNVTMQLLRYMVYIWEDYEKGMESRQKGISKTKAFAYPPILPIVYYEDTAAWTAATELKDRIFLYDMFREYLPNYRYLLFKLQEHRQSELIAKEDEISLIMLINRLRTASEVNQLTFPDGYFERLQTKAPEDVLTVICRIAAEYLRHLNMPEDEIGAVTDRIKERKMGRLFENFQGYDIQATRREARAEGKKEGKRLLLIELICKKLLRNKNPEDIAEELEEELSVVEEICRAAEDFAPDYDTEKIYAVMYPQAEENG